MLNQQTLSKYLMACIKTRCIDMDRISPFYSIILLCIVDSEIEEESEEDEDYIPSEDWKKVFFQNLY